MLSSWMQQKLIDDAPFNMMNVACHGCQALMHEQETEQSPLCVSVNYSFPIFILNVNDVYLHPSICLYLWQI